MITVQKGNRQYKIEEKDLKNYELKGFAKLGGDVTEPLVAEESEVEENIDEVAEESEVVDIEFLPVRELKEIAAKRNIEVPNSATKNEIIELLK